VKQICAVEASPHRLLALARMAGIVIYGQFLTCRDLEAESKMITIRPSFLFCDCTTTLTLLLF
jgi:hypothetical protein